MDAKVKKVLDMTTEEKALTFVDRVVLDKDTPQCSINDELEIIESSLLRVTWKVCPIMEAVLRELKIRGFNFRSPRGVELLGAIKVRYVLSEKHGYSKDEVKGLYKAVLEHAGVSLFRIFNQ